MGLQTAVLFVLIAVGLRALPASGDEPIVIRFESLSLIFDPGEPCRATALVLLTDSRDSRERAAKATVRWKVSSGDHFRPHAEGSSSVNVTVNGPHPVSLPIEFNAPRGEGVYTLQVEVTGRGFSDVESAAPLIVVDANRGPNRFPVTAGEKPKVVDSFDLATAGLMRKAAPGTILKGGELSLNRWLKPAPFKTETGAAVPAGAVAWAAYRLHVLHPQRPHRLHVTFAEPLPPGAGLLVLKANSAGQLVPAGPSVGFRRFPVETPSDARRASSSRSQSAAEQALILWPDQREPVVVISWPQDALPPQGGSVALYELGERLTASESRDNAVDQSTPNGRLCGPYLQQPSLIESFGPPTGVSSSGKGEAARFESLYIAATRLTEYLPSQGQNALLMSVCRAGVPIYQSRAFDGIRSTDNDNGLNWKETAGDPLELLFRLFDREGLTLIPEWQFSAPLPAIEQLIQENPESASEIRLSGSRGETDEKAPSPYNPLDERVQQAVREIIGELVDRYGHHPSFGGVALELGPQSFLQFPGLNWGYDLPTIGRFERVSEKQAPLRSTPERRFEFLTTEVRREWLNWRCRELADFHRSLIELVAAKAPAARVLFTGARLGSDPADLSAGFAQALKTRGNPQALLTMQGLDPTLLAQEPRLATLRPQWGSDEADPLERAALATINFSPALDNAVRLPRRGLLYAALPFERGLADTERNAGGLSILLAHVPATVDAARMAHSLAALDAQFLFEGSSPLALEFDEAALERRRMFASLPSEPFRLSGPQTQPVTIRVANSGNQTYLYIANDSGAPAHCDLSLNCPGATPLWTLGRGERLRLGPGNERGSVLAVDLGPFDVRGYRMRHPQAEVVDSRVSVSKPALAKMQSRLQEFQTRLNATRELAQARGWTLANPGFELTSARGNPDGWKIDAAQADWSLDDRQPRSGKIALRLSHDRGDSSLVSPEVPLDQTGFLTMALWMRGDKSSQRVQLVLEAELDGKPHRQIADVDVGKTWRRFLFRVNRLPPGAIEHARLRVSPLQRGTIWIDDVEVDLQLLHPDDLRQLAKTFTAAELAWQDQRYADCQRLLDGYWGQFLVSDSEPVSAAGPVPRPRIAERVRDLLRR